MQITDVETAWISLPLPETQGLSKFEITHSTDAVCRITTDEGLVGIGESRGSPLDEICEIIDQVLKPFLIGKDPVQVKYLWERMHELLCEGERLKDKWGYRTKLAAIAALDLALWDIKAKGGDQSVCELLGGRPQEVPAYISKGFYVEGRSLEEMAEDARRAVSKGGYEAVKIRIGRRGISDDRDRIEAVKKALGDEIDVMVDVNQAWDVEEAIEKTKQLEKYGLKWIEEPIPINEKDGYDPDASCGEIANFTDTPIASGENHVDLDRCFSLLEKGGIQFMQFDCVKNGGVTEFLRVSALCEAFGIPMAPHHVPHFHAQLLAAVPNSYMLEAFDYERQHPAWPQLFIGFPQVENGSIDVADKLGWGMEINDELIEEEGKKVHWKGS